MVNGNKNRRSQSELLMLCGKIAFVTIIILAHDANEVYNVHCNAVNCCYTNKCTQDSCNI